MSAAPSDTSPEEHRALERFYFHEARLLDNRQYKQWLGLLSESVRYVVPSRVNVQINNRDRGNEEMLHPDRELEGSDSMGAPLREEGYGLLMLRAERAYKINSWAEQPPARTRRIVGNVELMEREDNTLRVLSNFHLYYARPGSRQTLYSGQRRDVLKDTPKGFRIEDREVVLDYADIELPTLGLFF